MLQLTLIGATADTDLMAFCFAGILTQHHEAGVKEVQAAIAEAAAAAASTSGTGTVTMPGVSAFDMFCMAAARNSINSTFCAAAVQCCLYIELLHIDVAVTVTQDYLARGVLQVALMI